MPKCKPLSFLVSSRFIHAHNRQPLTYKLAINPLADWHSHELRRSRGRLTSKGYNGGKPFDTTGIKPEDVPDHIDWNVRGKGRMKEEDAPGSL